MRRVRHNPSRQGGFSIIELSIILAVAAFVIANAFIIGVAKKEVHKYNSAYDRMAEIKAALTHYVERYGHYPCPAGGLVSPHSNKFGKGVCTFEGNQDVANGLFKVTGAYSFGEGLIGVLPTKDLSLPSSYMIDQWGSRLTYAVIKNLTDSSTYSATMEGGIVINSPEGTLSRRAAYVVISHGENGIGSWPFMGAARKDSPVSGLYDGGELENHHMSLGDPWDFVFFYATRPPVDFSGHKMVFDDILVWSEQEDPITQDEIVGATPGYINSFAPNYLSGLVLWLDATDEGTIGRDENDHVVRWADKTDLHNNIIANDATTTSVTHMPTFIPAGSNVFTTLPDSKFKLNSVRFSENEPDALTIESDTGINTSNLTIFVVANSSTDDSPERKTLVGRGKSNSDDSNIFNGWGFSVTTDPLTRGFWMDDHAAAEKRNDHAFNGTEILSPKIWVAKYDANYWHFGLIKTYLACADMGSQPYTAPSLVPTGSMPIVVGAQYLDGANNGVFSLEGDIGEVLIYGTALSDYDRERVTRYLAQKWNLPDDFATCTMEFPQCLMGTNRTGTSDCTSNSQCCSGACSGEGKCCIPTNYSGGWEICSRDSDCCDGGAICNLFGACWRPTQ